jgi:uncharacterized protein (TIGR02453 family)
MVYFTKDSFRFLTDLEKNNEREWFNANKKRYTEDLKAPFEQFIADLIEAMTPFFESLPIAPKDAIFRIYRDVRFSKDKSPYKTRVSALVNPGGRKEMTRPGLYIEISAKEIRIYSGLYMLDTQQLKNVRSHISHNLGEFAKLINNTKFKATFGEVRGEQNKRIPKEFEEDLKNQPLLANKQFYYFTTLPTSAALKEGFIKEVVDTYKVAQPLSEFLYEGLF